TRRWKFVVAPRPELYDVEKDPKELHDVSAEYPRVAATLAHHLESMHLQKDGEEPAPAKLDAEALRRLQALGYVRGADSPTAPRAGRRPDPKDGMPLLQELLQGQADRDAGRLAAAASRLEALAHNDPENPAVFVALTSAYFRRNDSDGALRSAKRAVAL